jgi:predicted dehydrogenase
MTIDLDRRSLIRGAMATGAIAQASGIAAAGKRDRKRYVNVGVGARPRLFQEAIWTAYRDRAELVAICDTNPGRMAETAHRAAKAGVAPPRTYLAADFDRMLREVRPDVVIVTVPDALHEPYIIRALEAGCDVMTEKPMTTTAEMARSILDACHRTGRDVIVTFNYRYSPFRTQIKQMLMAGEIGDILSVDFNWQLDTTHGADYFRRWHSRKAMSGGLMVHKATHHFDLVNWWLSANPVEVSAQGRKGFYTPEMARRMGLSGPHERCHTCPEQAQCGFYLDIAADAGLRAIYYDNEKYDGYFRDQCVWRPEIDIEDNMNVIVDYDSGAKLSYSLNANSAWEGYTIAFNGTKGRLEHSAVESSYVAGGDMVQGATEGENVRIRVYPLRGPYRDVTPHIRPGGHAGGDPVMVEDLFGSPPPDPTRRAANQLSGAASIAIGIAANRCFAQGGSVKIADLLPNLAHPRMAPMPTAHDPVAMPPRLERKQRID